MVEKFIKKFCLALAFLFGKTTFEKASKEIEEILKKQMEKDGKLTLRRVFMNGYGCGYRAREDELWEIWREIKKEGADAKKENAEEGEAFIF